MLRDTYRLLRKIDQELQRIYAEHGARGVLVAIAITPLALYTVEVVSRGLSQMEDLDE
jgi:hypothetical protein